MNKDELTKMLHNLIMVTGDCPSEQGIGEATKCSNHDNCVECWKYELSKEIRRIDESEL